MGLQNNAPGSNARYLKLREDKVEGSPTKGSLRFCESVPSGEGDKKWKFSDETFEVLDGVLTEVTLGQYEWEGAMVDTATMTFKDGEETYKLDMGFNNITRSLFNSLASQPSFGRIKLQTGKNKTKEYNTVYVSNDGQNCKWLHAYGTYPKVEEILNKQGKRVGIDDTEVNDFFKKLIKSEIIPKLAKTATDDQSGEDEAPYRSQQSAPPVSAKAAPARTAATAQATAAAPEEKEYQTDDLPF